MALISNTLFSQEEEAFVNIQPISDGESYVGAATVVAAILMFGIIIRFVGM